MLTASMPASAQKWVTVWTASVQGPYPVGNASAQPDLRFAFPNPQAGARDQTFRLIVLPDFWTREGRLRFSNAFGTKAVTIDGVFAGLHLTGGAVGAASNRAVHFGGNLSVTIQPGQMAWSDPIPLAAAVHGRKLAVSFHIVGESGPMTWHAKALQTSYLSRPGAGRVGSSDDEGDFPFTTTSWFFLDAVDMRPSADTKVIVALGDSITDGTASTLNGDDRWPNVLARRLDAAYGDSAAVVLNAGIGGNQVAGPAEYSSAKPMAGGPAAWQRLDRDVLSLSGVTHVIWLEGINDFGSATNATVDTVTARMKEVVAKLKARGIRVVGATVVSALGATSAVHGSVEEDRKRQALNEWIRTSGTFDAVADFDKATLDPATGGLRPEFVPDSTAGGPGDRLHPNRAGYLAMGMAVDLKALLGR